ncbi:helix-turn-helix domain-containing protein [Ornithinimicrobium cryptoxanthini]|uniref:Helix-turn-helix domain-containing protein n=1 Tax=Ornithinimicrobium cryptoxanthini TaxID=2934161 RepID=A0ABY4YIX8_9MICO|nr:helix-turn-helix domain-containing protein [Ornithinimicrobium cryptoxanthini]USQ76734.1 helix-turn-helix domain-containing protein [Ornithinimicrobium cryptoxanthini]
MEAAQRGAARTPPLRGPSPSPQGGLVIIIAGTHEERLKLARVLPAGATALLAADIQQAGRVVAQLPQAADDPARASATQSPTQSPSPAQSPSPGLPRVHAQSQAPALLQLQHLRQRQNRPQHPQSQPQLRLRADRLSLSFGAREVPLTKLELDLLAHLLPRVGQTATFEQLSHVAWHTDYLGNGAHMHAAVGRLRAKLAELGAPVTLQAVRGLGFRLVSHSGEGSLREAVGS